ncbi:MAG: hypothetical protein JWQ71_4488 [Pedosphaera sp.]|nr:hypothetical protein [Pedosphaera sp.]
MLKGRILSLTLLAFALLNFSEVDAAIIAHWTFDESDGTIAHDSAGSVNGTLSTSGASFVSGGISGNALSLEFANNGFVNMGDVNAFTGGDFSLVAWLKATGGINDINMMVSKHAAFTANGYYLGYNLAGFGGPLNKGLIAEGDAQYAARSTTDVNDGAWHQLVAVYKAGGDKTIYVDGVAEGTAPSVSIQGNSVPLLIGGATFAGVPQGRFDGLIDDVQVYNHALVVSEVSYLFQNPGKVIEPIVATIAPAVQISWNSQANTAYQVQSTTNINSGTWIDVGTPVQGTGGTVFTFDATAGQAAKFYRIVALP